MGIPIPALAIAKARTRDTFPITRPVNTRYRVNDLGTLNGKFHLS